MRFFMLFVFALLSCSVIAAPVQQSSDVLTIPYTVDGCDPNYFDSILMDAIGSQIVIQDLTAGKLIIADLADPSAAPVEMSFPESLISLNISTNSLLALTSKGAVRFSSVKDFMEALKADFAKSKPIALKNLSLDSAKASLRILGDDKGYLVWNRDETKAYIFGTDGSYTDAYPCPSLPVLTGRSTFVSAFYDTGFGTRLIEIPFARPANDGKQHDDGWMFIEVKDERKFQLVDYNSGSMTFTGIMEPISPVIPTEEELQAKGLQSAPAKSQDDVEIPNAASMEMPIVKIDADGRLEKLGSLPDFVNNERVSPAQDSVLVLSAQFSKDGCTLKGLSVKRIENK